MNDLKLILWSVAFSSLFSAEVLSQNPINSGFEQIDGKSKKPTGWQTSLQSQSTGFKIKVDSLIKYKGKYSMCLEGDSTISTSQTEAISFTIPAIYAGFAIKLIGNLKTEGIGSDGSAGLMMRIESNAGVIEQDSMLAKKITGTRDWKKYAVELNLTDQTRRIVIGGWLKGRGKVWFDELNVYIEGKELEKTPIYKARLDSSFVRGSALNLSKLDKRKTKDLQILGQVWGFLKYHHPFIAAGNLNWDYELFRFVPSYLKSTSVKSRNQLLLDWVNKLGSVVRCEECKEKPDSLIKQKPDFAWINSKELGIDLKNRLEEIHKSRNRDRHYYASIGFGIGNAEFTNEDPYEQFTFPDDGFRLLALYRYWNIIQYFFPYRYAIDENWDSVLLAFVPRFINAKDKLEYRKAVVELIGKVHDTHANLWGRDSVWSNYKGKFIPPVQTKFIEDKLVVTNFYNDVVGRKSGINIGDVITAIDGVPTAQLVKERLNIYPASNYSTKLRDIAKDVLRGNKRYVSVRLEKGKETVTQSIKRFSIDSIDTRLDRSYYNPDSCYRFLSNDIGYINLGNIKNALVPKIMDTFKSTKGIIIDLRNYPSEFVVFSLGNYLVPTFTPFVKFTNADLTNPGLFGWGTTMKVGHENSDGYKGKVVILVNEITQSQAEYTAMALRTNKNSIVMGSTTAGADGNVSIFYLPGKLRTMISGIGIYYPNGQETQRVGIVPDIEVRPTLESIKEKRDELLDRAIAYIEQNKQLK